MKTMQMMKKLTRLKLINWHYFSNETIDFHNINLFSGENGAGKSTILDAIQLVLTTNTRRFNLAANADSNRNLKSYVRGKTGEEGNEYLRKKAVISYIALEIYEETKQRYFVIGAKFDSPDVESPVKVKWFCEECRLENLSFLAENKPARDEQFKNNGKKILFIPQNNMARDRWKRRLGNLQDNFFDLIPKSIAFKPMKNVKSFVSQFILPEKMIDIDVLRENIHSLKEMQSVVEEVKKQLESLEEIQKLYHQILKIDEHITITDILLQLSDICDKKESFSQKNKSLNFSEIQFSTYQKENETLTEKIKNLNERYTDVISSLKSGETFLLIHTLESELNSKEKDKKRLSDNIKTLKEQLDKIKNTQKKVSQLFKTEYSDIDLLAGTSVSIEEKNTFIIELENVFSGYKKEIDDNIYNTRTKIDSLTSDLIQLENEIKMLRKNKITYPQNSTELQNEIKKEFKARGIDSEVYIFSDLLEINNNNWQNAVEGYLNTQRFNIIVEPKYYDIAADVYNRCRNRIHSVAIVNTSKLKTDIKINENSLANVVKSDNRYAAAYVYYLLNRVIMCNNIHELKDHDISITESCMLYKNHTLRKINPEVYKMPFIGKFALEQQLKIKLEEQKKKSVEKRKLESERNKYEEASFQQRQCNFEIIKSLLDAPENIKKTSYDIEELKSKLNETKNDVNYIQLQMESDELKRKIYFEENKQRQIIQAMGKEEAEINRIKQELEYLEQKITVSEKILNELSENNESLLDEAKKQFEEQRKTRSFSDIFENCNRRRKKFETQKNEISGILISAQKNYKDGEFGTGSEMMPQYTEEYDQLSKNDLIKYEEKLRVMKENCETEFREGFLAKMRENIENAESVFKNLNKTLKPIYYGNDSYRFDYAPAKNKKRLYEMITSELNLGGFNLMSEQFDAEYHDEMEELFSKLTESSENGEEIISEYTDYRKYLDYDIDIISKDGKTQKFSKIYREKSGGETQTPYYVAIAASFTQIYSIGETIRIIILDEAFDKMDEERIKQMIHFFKIQNFQVILAAPTSRLELIGEESDNIVMIYSDENHNSFTQGISYDEL